MAGDYVASFLSELTHHFFQAVQSSGTVDKTITYATRAAERATAVLAYEEATAHYERALQMFLFKEPDAELHCELLLALGKAQQRTGDFTAAQQHFQQVAELARARQLSKQLADAPWGWYQDPSEWTKPYHPADTVRRVNPASAGRLCVPKPLCLPQSRISPPIYRFSC